MLAALTEQPYTQIAPNEPPKEWTRRRMSLVIKEKSAGKLFATIESSEYTFHKEIFA